MVNCGHLANPVSQSLSGARGAVLPWTLQSLATCGTAMEKKNNKNNKKTNKQMNSSYSWRPRKKKSRVMGN